MKKILILFFIFLINITNSQEEKRLALIIGNANYDKAALKNPVNDALLMKETLEKLNFDVIYDTNIEKEEGLEDIIVEFGKKRREYNVGFVYYAGHGIQLNGDNYLLPTKEIFNCEDDIRNNGVNIQTIMQYLKSTTNSVNVLVLDACRNNPLENRNCPNNSRSLNNEGLAKIVAPTGSLIAFSTSANTTALDGVGKNSLFCQSLAMNLMKPDKTLNQIFQNVRSDVLRESKKTGRVQEPEEASKLIGDYYFQKTDMFEFLETIKTLDPEDYKLLLSSYLGTKNNKLVLRENLDSNIIKSTKIIELDNNNFLAYKNRRDAYFKLKKFEEALEDNNKWCELDSENHESFLNRAYIKEELEDIKGALEDYSNCTILSNNSFNAYFRRARMEDKLGYFNESIIDYTKCIELINDRHTNFYIRYLRGLSKFKIQDYKGSINDLELMQDFYKHPDSDPAKASRMKLQGIYLYSFAKNIYWPSAYNTGDFTIGIYGSEDYFDLLSANFQGKMTGSQKIIFDFYESISDIKNCHLLFVPKEENKSLKQIQKKLNNKTVLVTQTRYPENTASLINFIYVQSRLKFQLNENLAKSKNFKFGQTLKKLAYSNFTRSKKLLSQGDYINEVDKENSEENKAPSSIGEFEDYKRADAFNILGQSNYYLGNYKDAVRDFSNNINLDSNSIEGYKFRGQSRYKLKDYKGALEDISKFFELTKNNDNALLYRYLANCKKKLKINNYCEDFKKACDLEDNNSCKIYYKKCNSKIE